MPKSSNQKLLYLRRILLEETDDNHHLNAEQLVSKLEQLGINADRKTIYADVAALQDYGMDIFLQRGPGGGYSVSSREFELPELKLLVDAIQCSRFITEKKSRELIGKIESLASREEARQLQRQVYVSDRLKNIDEKIYYISAAASVRQRIRARCSACFPDMRRSCACAAARMPSTSCATGSAPSLWCSQTTAHISLRA